MNQRIKRFSKADLDQQSILKIKKGIWLYFLLLIFEGALRKWILPGLATPLLIIRDPIAIWIVIFSINQGILKVNWYVKICIFIGLLSILTALLWGHGNIFVAIYGARILLFHFPLIFVISDVFTKEDVIKLGKVSLYIAIPMTLLIGLQFYSPQSALVNRGVGGDMKGAGFTGALGFLRPPGTFSFGNGVSLFYSFLAPFVMYFWLFPKQINRYLLILATLALIMAIPLSISRTLLFQVGISVLFMVIVAMRKPEFLTRMILGIFITVILFIVLSNVSVFSTATSAFSNRFESANRNEGGVESAVFDRFIGNLWLSITPQEGAPFFGYGAGMGTNVGGMLINGETHFYISENEWGRLIGEMGLLMGLCVIIMRLVLCIDIIMVSYKKLTRGTSMPWLLLSFALVIILQGGWAQPTSLGFCVMIGGLLLASVKSNSQPVLNYNNKNANSFNK